MLNLTQTCSILLVSINFHSMMTTICSKYTHRRKYSFYIRCTPYYAQTPWFTSHDVVCRSAASQRVLPKCSTHLCHCLTLPHSHSTLLTPSYTLIHTLHLTPHWHTLSFAPTPHFTPHSPCITSPNIAHSSPHDPPHPTSPHPLPPKTTAPNFITLTSFRGILGNGNSVVKLAITFGASGHLSPWSLQASGMGGLNV